MDNKHFLKLLKEAGPHILRVRTCNRAYGRIIMTAEFSTADAWHDVMVDPNVNLAIMRWNDGVKCHVHYVDDQWTETDEWIGVMDDVMSHYGRVGNHWVQMAELYLTLERAQ